MLAARGGRSEKEKDRKDRNHYKSTGLCSQRRGVGEDGVGAGPFPGGARRWEVARTKRNTTPKWAPDAPRPPSPPPHPTHERDTAPLPTQITRGDTVSPPHGQTYPPWNPHGRDGPPSQGSLTRRCPPQETFTWSTQALPTPETAPTQGRNGSRGGLPRERVVS